MNKIKKKKITILILLYMKREFCWIMLGAHKYWGGDFTLYV